MSFINYKQIVYVNKKSVFFKWLEKKSSDSGFIIE